MQLGGGLYTPPVVSPGPQASPGLPSPSLVQALLKSSSGGMPSLQNPAPQIPLSTIASLAKPDQNGQTLNDRMFGLGGTFGDGGFFSRLFGGGYLGTAGTGDPANQFGDAMSAGYDPFAVTNPLPSVTMGGGLNFSPTG